MTSRQLRRYAAKEMTMKTQLALTALALALAVSSMAMPASARTHGSIINVSRDDECPTFTRLMRPTCNEGRANNATPHSPPPPHQVNLK